MNKKLTKAILSGVVIIGLSVFANNSHTDANVFKDVPADSPHTKNIERLVDMNVINGYGNGKFGFDDPIKREHVLKMMHAILKDDLKVVRSYKGFSDVSTSNPYYYAIKWGYEVGVIDGHNGKFKPSNFITRAEMAKVLAEAFDVNTTEKYKFADVSSQNWAYTYVNALAAKGITQISNGQFNPTDATKRSEMASFLIRALDDKNGIKQPVVVQQVTEQKTETKPSVKEPEQIQVVDKQQTLPAATYYDSGYDLNWTVKEGTKTLELTGYSNDKIVGHYVRGAGKSIQGISIGMTKAQVINAKSGKFTNVISFKNGNYRLEKEKDPAKAEEKLIFEENGFITTVFLDNFQNNKVVGILSIEASKYKSKNYYYNGSTKLRGDYEKLMTILINQTRKEFGISTVKYTPEWNTIARKHSQDMIDRNYFAHNSPDGQTLADRFKAGGLKYTSGGENIAYGQETVIHSHEAFMNSEGHRKNILNTKHKNVFVGVAFKPANQVPYFTVNFFTQ